MNNKMEINRLTEANNAFRRFGEELSNFNIPDNRGNKLMSLLLGSLESFELISTRYETVRNKIQEIHKEEEILEQLNKTKVLGEFVVVGVLRQIAFTVIPYRPRSLAKFLVKLSKPAFAIP